jgi:hypothetical protein
MYAHILSLSEFQKQTTMLIVILSPGTSCCNISYIFWQREKNERNRIQKNERRLKTLCRYSGLPCGLPSKYYVCIIPSLPIGPSAPPRFLHVFQCKGSLVILASWRDPKMVMIENYLNYKDKTQSHPPECGLLCEIRDDIPYFSLILLSIYW